MPLIGIIDDITGEQFTFAEAIERARWGKGGHEPLPLVVAMSKNAEERADAGISATMLLSCPRETILKELVPYCERPSDYWARFRGTIGHLMMEAYGETKGVMQEVRFRKEITVNGVCTQVTGKPDWVDLERQLIIDFKSVGSINRKPVNQGIPKPGHTEQVNIYRWLLADGMAMKHSEHTIQGQVYDFPIRYGGIQYFDMKGYRKIAVPIWPLERTQSFINEHLWPILEYRATNILPTCHRTLGVHSYCKCADYEALLER